LAGFATPLPFYFGYAGEPIEPPEPEPDRIIKGGGGGILYREDEEILAVILAASRRWG
jgi:hypothetical protein